jgi:hypothetical protein
MNDQTASPPSAFQRHLPLLHRVLCSRRWWRALGFTTLGLITLLALFYAVANWRGARAWKEVRDELRAQGEPLSFAELLPPMPPDEENFAMTPYFRGFFDKALSSDGKTPVWAVRQQESRLPDWPDKLKGNRTWRLGERHEFAWNRRAEDPGLVAGVDIATLPPIEAVRQLLEQSRPILEEIETAALRPSSRFPIHYADNWSALLPHLASLRGLGRLFSLRALKRLEAGDAVPALQDVLTTIRLAESLRDEPVLISGLVRIAILELAMQPIWQGLAERKWDDGQLRDLQSQLEAIDMLVAYRFSARGERIFAQEFCDLVERERNLGEMGMLNGSDDSYSLQRLLWNYAPRGWYVDNKAMITQMHQDYSLPAIDPVARRYHPEKANAYDAAVARMLDRRFKYFLARMILPAAGKPPKEFVLAQTNLDQAVTALALERHRLAHGGYPTTLAELSPEYLASIPHDIMDGQPLRYRVADGNYVLYSVGANGTDDDGQAAFKELKDGRTWQRDEGDWVWQYPEAAG